MRRHLTRALREPLLHFLIIGAVIFGLYWVYDGQQETPASERIIVTPGTVNTIVQTFRLKRLRAPTKAELESLIEDHVKEEIYYREALKLGLDKNDTIVRRRLRQKMEFLLQNRLSNLTPTDAELSAYLAKHADRYRQKDRVSFVQVYLSRARRGEKVEADARRMLAELRSAEGKVDIDRHSDSLLLPARFKEASEDEIARVFGAGFVKLLRGAPVGEWTGPLVSGYGLHLVRVSSRKKGPSPKLKDVRAAVTRDWLEEQHREMAAAFYKALRARYAVTVEGGDTPGSSESGRKPAK